MTYQRLKSPTQRIAANWEKHKHLFVGRTDKEVRELADNWMKTANDPGMPEDGFRYGYFCHNKENLMAGSFAAEEELRKRGSDL
jgi:hypothetical protein